MYNINLTIGIRFVPNLPILSNVQKLNVTRPMVEVQNRHHSLAVYRIQTTVFVP